MATNVSIDALLRGAPTDEEQLVAMSNALRGKRNAAQLLGMSTVAPISKMGVSGVVDVDAQAAQAGRMRQSEIQRQDALQKAKQAQQNWERDFAFKEKQAEENRALKKSIAELRAGKGASTDEGQFMSKLPASERPRYRTSVAAISKFPEIISRVQENPDAFGSFSAPAEYMPEWTPNMIMEPTKDWRDAQFTSEQRRARNAVYREAYQVIKELAGTAVSKHEKGRIEQFLPSPNAEPEVVIDKLKDAMEYAKNNLDSFRVYGEVPYRDGMANEVQDPEVDYGNERPDFIPEDTWDMLTPQEKNEILSGE